MTFTKNDNLGGQENEKDKKQLEDKEIIKIIQEFLYML
jgi:hypothetical protein